MPAAPALPSRPPPPACAAPAAGAAPDGGAAAAWPWPRPSAGGAAPRRPLPPNAVTGSFDARPFGITTIIGTALLAGDQVVEDAVGGPELRPVVLVAADPVQQVEHGVFPGGGVARRQIDHRRPLPPVTADEYSIRSTRPAATPCCRTSNPCGAGANVAAVWASSVLVYTARPTSVAAGINRSPAMSLLL